VEHVERQEEREQELRADADRLEQQGDQMEEERDRVDKQIGDVREEFERKKQSEDVPGAQEQDGHSIGSEPPPEASISPGDSDEVTDDDD
jgi:hypothetical protein